MKRLLMGLIFILTFLMTTFYSATDIFAIEKGELDIGKFPDSERFNITNMVPGDWAESTLTILNVDETNITYRIEAEFTSGSEKLYNHFLIQVLDANGEIFSGKLHELDELKPIYLKAFHQEDLKFLIKFPEELGNEYRGLNFIFELKFLIENQNELAGPTSQANPSNLENLNDKDDKETSNVGTTLKPQHPINPEDLGSISVNNKIVPSTSNTFNYMIAGSFLISGGAIAFVLQRRKWENKYINKPLING